MPLRPLVPLALVALACSPPEAKPEPRAEPAAPAVPADPGPPSGAPVTACPKALGGRERVNRVISRDCGVVPVTEDYYVDGGSLTLEAGSSLSFGDGVGLYIGYYEPAKLIAQGTAAAPVVLTSTGDKAAGVWRGVSLNEHATGSTLDGVVIEYAGNDESALYVAAQAVTLRHSKIRAAKGTGLLIGDAGGFAEFTDNELKKLGDKAAISGPAMALGGLGGGNRFDPGAHVQVRGGAVSRSARWGSIGAPLVIGGEVFIDGEGERATVELAPGLELRFGEAGALVVGLYKPGALLAKGSAEAPIVFTAHERREAGGWGGVTVHAQGEATIDQAAFEFAGKLEDSGALAVRGGSLTLTGTTFRSNKVGVTADEAARLPGFSDNKFVATPIAAVVPVGLLGALAESNAYDRDSRIHSPGGALTGTATWHAQGVPIELRGEVHIDGALTLEPGVALLAAPGAKLTVGAHEAASLRVGGTAVDPVTFGPADPARSWPGLVLAAKARGNVLEHLVMTGVGAAAAIDVAAGVDAKLEGVTCSRCSGAVVGWACGATVHSSQVLAADGTTQIELRPAGC